MYARGYKKLWELYEINSNDDWYLQAVAGTIFGCSGTHFPTKFGLTREWFVIQNQRRYHRIPYQIFLRIRHFDKNFIFENGRKLSFYGRVFFRPFYQNHLIWSRWRLGVFRSRQIRILWDNWATFIFGGSGSPSCTERGPISRTVGHTGSAISPWCFSLNSSKGWCSFVRILKSSNIGENAFTKGFFSVILLKSPDLDEMASTTVFEVVKFASVVKIDLDYFTIMFLVKFY